MRVEPGGHIRVIVTAVNPIEGLIDLELAAEPTESAEPAGTEE